MNRHPGGQRNTLKLIEMAGISPPLKILDMGSGGGETVALLKSMGYDALGVDKQDGSDFLNLDFDDESFDAVISECAFFVSGNQKKAISEAFRVLKKGGVLMLADVFDDEIPFDVQKEEDITKEWTEYYLEKLWSEDDVCQFPHKKGKIRYYLLTGRKS